MATGPAATGPTAAEVADRLAVIRRRIDRCAPDPSIVAVVAVTKGFGPDAVRAALAAGITDIGENYAAELLSKAAALDPDAQPVWHYLGAVQRNKVARLAPIVGCWQSVSRMEEGTAVNRRRPGVPVLVQVDIAGLPGRLGCRPEAVPELVGTLRDAKISVRGLMAVGVPGPPEGSRAGFRRVVELADELGLPVRSLGMSDDLEVALSEGSTMVRVGRALFGDRPPAGARPGPSG
jgi:PLP dependent protein